jgi:hypothetical protein
MSQFAVHPSIRETTERVHFTSNGRTPLCTVLFQDSDYNGLVKRLQMSRLWKRVTCKRCLWRREP